jgi:predicted Fe-Mo cluster-binding NifX family protein
MKVAVSSTGKDLNSQVSDNFGRCPFFIMAKIENGEIKALEAMENLSQEQMGGAGISAARAVVEKGVGAVIVANIGPRALAVLSQFKVDVFKGRGSVRKSLQEFIQGKLEKL